MKVDPTSQRAARVKVLVAAVTVGGAALATAGLLAWQLAMTQLGVAHVRRDDAGRALGDFARAQQVNLVEDWIAPYDQGIARYMAGNYDAAAADFSDAAASAPQDQQCRVRLNWSAALVAAGDQYSTGDAADPDAALARWTNARVVLAEASCQGEAERQRQAEQNQLSERLGGSPDDAQQDDAAGQQQATQLNEREAAAAQQRQQAQDAESTPRGASGSGEKRW